MPKLDRYFNIAELRKAAKKKLPAPIFHYLDGGADDEWPLRRNTSALAGRETSMWPISNKIRQAPDK